jgi:hypothetical protein
MIRPQAVALRKQKDKLSSYKLMKLNDGVILPQGTSGIWLVGHA